MRNSETITVAELIEKLRNWNHGAQPASCQYATTPKLTKEGKLKFGDVTRLANIGIMLGYKYENSVNNQRQRENELQNFMSQPLWKGKGKRISTALATHIDKGTFYMSYKKQQTFKSFHFDTVLNFIPVALLKPFFPTYKNNSQGVKKEVYHREISVTNIRRLKYKNKTYIIVPE